MTVLVAAAIAILISVTLGAVALSAAAEASRRAGVAADLSALAGALRLRDGGDTVDACAGAARTARRNGARLVSCSADGESVVTVSCSARSLVGFPGAGRIAVRWARAGPDPRG